jgi:hypothetical protein
VSINWLDSLGLRAVAALEAGLDFSQNQPLRER